MNVNTARSRWWAFGGVAMIAILPACASSPQAASESPGEAPPIAKVHRAKCASCHEPPEPGIRSRATLEAAVTRHRARLKLSSAEWAAMVDFLATPASPRAKRDDSVVR
jgi:hypothetical protein